MSWFDYTENGDNLKINTDYIVMMNDSTFTVILVGGVRVRFTQTEYNRLQDKLFPPKKAAEKGDATYELLQKLHQLTGGKNVAILTPQRQKKLLALIEVMRGKGSEKITAEEAIQKIIKAATNIGQDKFLQGENDNHKRYGDIDYLLRPDKAAKYAEIDTTQKRKPMF